MSTQDRRFVLELCAFFDSLPQPETMIVGERAADGTLISREAPTPQVKLAKAFEEGIARAERSGFRSARAALRLGLQEVLDMSRDLSGQQVRTVDDRMAASSLPTLTAMRERVWQTVSKVLKRGKCRTDLEYYLVIERISGVSDLTLSTEERERLEQIVGQYETRRSR
jgi:hypothetical protein